MVYQKSKSRYEYLGKLDDTKASDHVHLLWRGILWNTVPAGIRLKGLSLPSSSSDSTCSIEAPVWGAGGVSELRTPSGGLRQL